MSALENALTNPEIDASDIASLVTFRGDPYQVLSLYLDVDGRRQELSEVRSRSHSLLHQAREELMQQWKDERSGAWGEHGVREAALDDLERCRAFLDRQIPRGACRGLALFSCTGRDWWQAYRLRRPVRDRWAWDASPLVLPTLRLLEQAVQRGSAATEPSIAGGEQREPEREAGLVRQLYDVWRSGGDAVVGVAETLRALYLDEVQVLLIDAEFRLGGYRCARCGALTASGERCPICGFADLAACPDLADAAISDALARGGRVELLDAPGELRGQGGMGALLRFRPQAPRAEETSPETRARTGEW